MPHISFAHSSADGHRGCLHALPTVDTAVNTAVRVSERAPSHSLSKYPEVEQTDHSSVFGFLSNPTLSSVAAAPNYIPTRSAEGFPFLPPHQHLLLLTFLVTAFLMGMRYSLCGSDLHFPSD